MGAGQEKANFELGESIASVADIAILIGVNKENIRLGMLSEGYCDKNIYTVTHLDDAKIYLPQCSKKATFCFCKMICPIIIEQCSMEFE